MAKDEAYAVAVGWLRSAPAARPGGGLALRAFGAALFSGVVVLGAIGLFSPSSFGAPGSRAFGDRWPSYALAASLGCALLWCVWRWRYLRWLLARLREPLRRPLSEEPHFSETSAALEASTPASVGRFGVAWVWGPTVAAVIAVMFAWSAAYFVIDAVLARFQVGWEQPVLAAANALLSIVVFALAGPRLARWRIAVSAHRNATTGYL